MEVCCLLWLEASKKWGRDGFKRRCFGRPTAADVDASEKDRVKPGRHERLKPGQGRTVLLYFNLMLCQSFPILQQVQDCKVRVRRYFSLVSCIILSPSAQVILTAIQVDINLGPHLWRVGLSRSWITLLLGAGKEGF